MEAVYVRYVKCNARRSLAIGRKTKRHDVTVGHLFQLQPNIAFVINNVMLIETALYAPAALHELKTIAVAIT